MRKDGTGLSLTNMEIMITKPPVSLIAILLVFSCCSCGEDAVLVEKKNAQATEITRLKGEINLLEEKIKNLPPDVTEELEAKRNEIEEQKAVIKKLEAEVWDQEERKNDLQREFDIYRARYKIE